ncbi:ABC transporter ATP-binding protein [Pelagibacterium sediminicola]|uniref:ABC transporter ATP-binding protein n=1 Tax=Pelagibacterium sediminicola TaxID=2248761 RepID=UPI000E31DF13|nr:ABC transporter ATP-binding protein [Pelagibacterium sediminicola]
MTEKAIEFADVVKRYGTVTAVDRISFSIERGELVTFLGPSGCGKTTSLRLIAGLELPSEGVVRIAGEDVSTRAASERNVGMVFQSYALFPHMSVIENVAYGPTIRGGDKKAAADRGYEILAMLGLEGLGKRLPSELSGGQQQRVAVARAIVQQPDVLLFDEPLSNVDAKLRRRVRQEIRDLQRRFNLTAVYVTHDQEEALAVSDRIVVMNQGRIAQIGTPAELYNQPNSRFVADFIGDANLIEGHVEGGRFKAGDLTLAVDGSPDRPKATVSVRPERIVFDGGAVRAKVRDATYLGSRYEYSLETSFGSLLASAPIVSTPLSPGTEVGITVPPDGFTLLKN